MNRLLLIFLSDIWDKINLKCVSVNLVWIILSTTYTRAPTTGWLELVFIFSILEAADGLIAICKILLLTVSVIISYPASGETCLTELSSVCLAHQIEEYVSKLFITNHNPSEQSDIFQCWPSPLLTLVRGSGQYQYCWAGLVWQCGPRRSAQSQLIMAELLGQELRPTAAGPT